MLAMRLVIQPTILVVLLVLLAISHLAANYYSVVISGKLGFNLDLSFMQQNYHLDIKVSVFISATYNLCSLISPITLAWQYLA